MMSGAGAEPCYAGPPPPWLIIASAIFLFIFLATFLTLMSLAFCCRRRWRERDAVAAYGEGARSAGDSGGCEPFPVESLTPAYAYVGSSDDGLHGGEKATAASGRRECAVCLGAVRDGEMVRRLPACEHVYHAECIDRWLAAHRTCPLCRSELDPGKVASGAPPAAQAAQEVQFDQLPV